MLFIKSLAAVGFLATTVLADGAAIVASLNKIDGDTAALNTSVARLEAYSGFCPSRLTNQRIGVRPQIWTSFTRTTHAYSICFA